MSTLERRKYYYDKWVEGKLTLDNLGSEQFLYYFILRFNEVMRPDNPEEYLDKGNHRYLNMFFILKYRIPKEQIFLHIDTLMDVIKESGKIFDDPHQLYVLQPLVIAKNRRDQIIFPTLMDEFMPEVIARIKASRCPHCPYNRNIHRHSPDLD